MATVYEATDLRLDRTVAVKVMHPGLGDDDEFAARFVAEARAAAKLSHPNVVAVFDQGNDDGTVFLAMELIPGHTLRDTIGKEAPLSAARTLALLEPVRLRAGGRAPRRPDPPRRQARERPHLRRRPDQGRRLRPGQGHERHHPAHLDRRPHRDRLVRRPRARRRGPLRRPGRRLRRGRDPLRAPHRQEAARGRDADPGRLQARARGRPAALAAGAGHPGLRRRACRPGHRSRPGAAARRRRRAAAPPAPGQPGRQRGSPQRPGAGR